MHSYKTICNKILSIAYSSFNARINFYIKHYILVIEGQQNSLSRYPFSFSGRQRYKHNSRKVTILWEIEVPK